MLQEATKPNKIPMVHEGTDKILQSIAIGSTTGITNPWRVVLGELDLSTASSSDLAMQSKMNNLEKKVALLESKLANMIECFVQDSTKEIEIREIPYDQAKKEIRQFFTDHHGEYFDAADIQEELGIDIDLAFDVLEALRKEGKIK